MAHLHVFTVGPVGLRVKVTKESVVQHKGLGNWPDKLMRHLQVEITDPSDSVTKVGVVFPADGFDEATSAEQAAEYTLEVIKKFGKRVSDTTSSEFDYGMIPGRYAAYLWQLLMPYEIHGKAGRRFSKGQAGQGLGTFKIMRLNPSGRLIGGLRTKALLAMSIEGDGGYSIEALSVEDALKAEQLAKNRGLTVEWYAVKNIRLVRERGPYVRRHPHSVKRSRFGRDTNLIVIYFPDISRGRRR